MEMGEVAPVANGNHGGVANGDVLLHQGVPENLVGVAGRKRGREDVEVETFKRARHDGINCLPIFSNIPA